MLLPAGYRNARHQFTQLCSELTSKCWLYKILQVSLFVAIARYSGKTNPEHNYFAGAFWASERNLWELSHTLKFYIRPFYLLDSSSSSSAELAPNLARTNIARIHRLSPFIAFACSGRAAGAGVLRLLGFGHKATAGSSYSYRNGKAKERTCRQGSSCYCRSRPVHEDKLIRSTMSAQRGKRALTVCSFVCLWTRQLENVVTYNPEL